MSFDIRFSQVIHISTDIHFFFFFNIFRYRTDRFGSGKWYLNDSEHRERQNRLNLLEKLKHQKSKRIFETTDYQKNIGEANK